MKKSKWKAYQKNQVRKQMKDKFLRRSKYVRPDYLRLVKSD